MKRLFLFLAAASVIFAGCQKQAVTTAPVDDYSDAPWAVDESLAVPIVFGGETFSVKTTKAALTSMTDVEFGVLAVDLADMKHWALQGDQTKEEEFDNAVLLFNKVAKKGDDAFAEFVDGVHYYPLETLRPHNYTFYGYRASDDNLANNADAFKPVLKQTENDTTYTIAASVGYADIIWAKAECTAPISYEDVSYMGYNSQYSRVARIVYGSGWTTYAPNLVFSHLTAALHFNVVAANAEAEASFGEDLVKVKNLVVGGYDVDATAPLATIHTAATLDILKGTITAGQTVASLPVSAGTSIVPKVYDPAHPEDTEFGKGLFILPQTEDQAVKFSIDTPTGTYTPPKPFKVTPPAGGFVAGKSYRFRIIVKSLERIQIKVELENWEKYDFSGTDDVVTTIG